MIRSTIVAVANRWPHAWSILHQIGAILTVWALICIVGTLAGCSMVPYYSQLKSVADTGIVTGIEDRKHFNDVKASTLAAVLGDMSVGAYFRNFTDDQRCAIQALVNGTATANCNSNDRLAAAIEKLTKPASP
jgi:hypothetical protein